MKPGRPKKRSSFEPGRMLASIAISLGLLALGLSFYNPITGASEPATPSPVSQVQLDALPELEEQAQASQLTAAAASDEKLSPTSQANAPKPTATPRPSTPMRTAAPIDALPASKVKAVSSGASNRTSGGSTSSVAAYTGPLSVSLVALAGDAAHALAEDLSARLQESGREVSLTSLDEVGRSDVLLVLDSLGSSMQAWYCDPGPAGNVELAKELMKALPSPPGASGAPDPEFASIFSCDDVHAGRAQTAAVLLEVSSAPELNLDETAALISEAVNRYLDENDRTLRQARGATRAIWPASGPITSYFGPSHPLGIDIGQITGNIVAALDGKVLFAGGDPCCSYGLYVVMDNGNGVNTVYGHLSALNVRTGQVVKQGQALGPVGCTGHCSGNHLHFEYWVNGVRMDPMRYLP